MSVFEEGESMKTKEQLKEEASCELLTNIQKCPHVDTGGKGHHMARAKKLCEELGIEPTSERLKIISDTIRSFEDERMTAVREAQRPRIEVLKDRIRKFK